MPCWTATTGQHGSFCREQQLDSISITRGKRRVPGAGHHQACRQASTCCTAGHTPDRVKELQAWRPTQQDQLPRGWLHCHTGWSWGGRRAAHATNGRLNLHGCQINLCSRASGSLVAAAFE